MAAAGAESALPAHRTRGDGVQADRPRTCRRSSASPIIAERHFRTRTPGRRRPDRLPRLQLRTSPSVPAPPASRSTTSSRRKSGRGGATACGRSASCCTGVLTALPFEDDWYRVAARRTRTTSATRTSTNSAAQQLDPAFLAEQRGKAGPIVGALARLAEPGGRRRTSPIMLAAAAKVRAARPDVRFLVAAFNERQAATARAAMAAEPGLPVEVHVGRTPEIIELADACISVSGSVSLELMYRAKPTVIVYRDHAPAALARAAVRRAAVLHPGQPAREGGTVPGVRHA